VVVTPSNERVSAKDFYELVAQVCKLQRSFLYGRANCIISIDGIDEGAD
jgi:hypothetical protein